MIHRLIDTPKMMYVGMHGYQKLKARENIG